MNIQEMLKALSPKRESVTINGFTFYARPMTVAEFQEHVSNADKADRDERTIVKCVEDEDGNPVFENIEQVKQLYTNIRAQLIGLVALASLLPENSEIEKEAK